MQATARSERGRPPTTSFRLVNAEFGHPKADLIAPTSRGYLYIAAAVQPGPTPVVLPSGRRADLLTHLKTVAAQLRSLEKVLSVDLFRAIVMPSTARFNAYLNQRSGSRDVANFDVSMLIDAVNRGDRPDTETRPVCRPHIETLRQRAQRVYVMPGHNVRRIGEVDTTRQGLFLFNHFVADDRDVMLDLSDYLAGWYAAETGPRTSVALMPIAGQPDDFTIVNWARWDEHPLRHFWHQLSKRSFWKYVTVNLDANHAASMPIYCRLA